MAVKKITYDGTVLIDLTNDTASAADVRTGKTFHAADGTIQTGTYTGGTDNMPNFIKRTYTFDTITFMNDYTYVGSGAFCYYPGSNAFLSFTNVVSISAYAFQYASFAGLAFPKCTTIGAYAFAYCSITNMAFPSVTTLTASAFASYRGHSIPSTMFSNVTTIGSSAFRSANTVTNMAFPKATIASQYAFANMASLTTASLPKLTYATVGLFYQCYSLASIYLPSASYVSNATFAYCSYLTAIYFDNLKAVNSTFAFRNCLRLISLYLLGSTVATLTNANAFTSTPISNYSTTAHQYGTIYVRASLLASYKAATRWSAYSARMVGLTDAEIAALPIYS